MSTKALGNSFDIHTGGIDLIFPHHTNEIAQSECSTEKKPFVRYWMHAGFLNMKEGKMSKSLGDILTLKTLKEKRFLPLEYRYMTLTTHYRAPLYFSIQNLEASKNSYERLKNICSELKDDKKTNKKYLEEFKSKIEDDLNMPEALQVLWKMLRDEKAEGKLNTIREMDSVLGLKLLEKEKIKVPESVAKLVKDRENARKNKDWKKSDELRDKINKLGYSVADTNEGSKIGKL